MKSPTSSVGRIDDDGILNGSARNERSRKTTSRTGKNAFEYSTQPGSRRRSASIDVRSATPASPVRRRHAGARRDRPAPHGQRLSAAGEHQAVERPHHAGDGGQHEQQQREVHRPFERRVARRAAESPAARIVARATGRRPAARPRRSSFVAGRPGHFSPTCRMARNASCGISTLPTDFMRFLPAFCFSSSFFLRVMSPP
jgi:hypothetical protein